MNSLNFANDLNTIGGLAQCGLSYNVVHLPNKELCTSENNLSRVDPGSSKRKTAVNKMDNLLMAVASSRDRGAFRELFDHFAPRMKSFLLGKGSSAEIAEEAVQEAMLNVWRKAGQFDPQKASSSTWIFAIVRNTQIDLLRKANRPEPDVNDPALVPDPPRSAFETVSAAESANRIRKCVDMLPPDQQDVLRLAFFEELSHGAIAQKLDIPLGTVKSRVRLALQRIRSEIGDSK
tara:strand:- start:4245 stop:4946 length:702 start_codon:yes stop_codon:yes gene_type:complete